MKNTLVHRHLLSRSIMCACRHNYDECNHELIICSFLYSLYDAGKSTGITVSHYSSRISGYQIGVVKGNEIGQEVCFTILVQLVVQQPQLIVLITMAESNFSRTPH